MEMYLWLYIRLNLQDLVDMAQRCTVALDVFIEDKVCAE